MTTDSQAEHLTQKQRNALHLYCELLAKALNDAGLDMKKTLKPGIEIPWTKMAVKDHLWRPIQKALTEKESTEDVTTVEPSEIYDVLNRHIGEKFGVHVDWPSLDTQYTNRQIDSSHR